MHLRENINRAHSDLTTLYNDVVVNEKSDNKLGNYIELSVNQSGKSLVMIIEKQDLEFKDFKWRYKANPVDSQTHLVERVSNISEFINDVKDVMDNNRFDSDYLKSIG